LVSKIGLPYQKSDSKIGINYEKSGLQKWVILIKNKSFYGGCRNSLAGVAVSGWFIKTTLAGWVLASSVCASKHAGWVMSVVSISWDDHA